MPTPASDVSTTDGTNVQEVIDRNTFATVSSLVGTSLGPVSAGIIWRAADFTYAEVAANGHRATQGGAELDQIPRGGIFDLDAIADAGELSDALAKTGGATDYAARHVTGGTAPLFRARDEVVVVADVTIRGGSAIDADENAIVIGSVGNSTETLAEQQDRTRWNIFDVISQNSGSATLNISSYGFVSSTENAYVSRVVVRNLPNSNGGDTDGIYNKTHLSVLDNLWAHNVEATDGMIAIKGNDPLAGTTGPLGHDNLYRNLAVSMDATFAGDLSGVGRGIRIACGGNVIQNFYALGIPGHALFIGTAPTDFIVTGGVAKNCGLAGDGAVRHNNVGPDSGSGTYSYEGIIVKDSAGHAFEVTAVENSSVVQFLNCHAIGTANAAFNIDPPAAGENDLEVEIVGGSSRDIAQNFIQTGTVALKRLKIVNHAVEAVGGEILDINCPVGELEVDRLVHKESNGNASLTNSVVIPVTASQGLAGTIVVRASKASSIYQRVVDFVAQRDSGTTVTIVQDEVSQQHSGSDAANWSSDMAAGTGVIRVRTNANGISDVNWQITVELWGKA